MLEREVKLGAAPGFHLPDLAGVAEGVVATEPQELRLETVYWDTADLNLARWGCSLRHRGGEGWTLKLPARSENGPLLERPELEFDGPPKKPPEAAVAIVRAYVRSAELRPVARLSTLRQRIRLQDEAGRSLLDVTDDEVSVLDGRRVAARFRELEVEVREGGDSLLEPVLELLRAGGAGPADQVSKNVRALGPRAQTPPEVRADVLAPPLLAGDAVKAVIAFSVAQLLRHDPGIRAGSDPESVHQARVAVRRLRSQLRTFGDVLEPGWTAELRDDLAWLGGELGRARDAEVLAERLKQRIVELPEVDRRAAESLIGGLNSEAAAAREQVRTTLDSERYLVLLERLVAAANQPPLLDTASLSTADVIPALASAEWRRLRRAVRALDASSSDEVLHQARIAAKRARYAAEAAAASGSDGAGTFAKAAAGLQTVLGEHQDAVTAQAWLRSAAGSGRRAFVSGELCALEAGAAARARTRWPAAWRDLKRKRNRRWLRD